MSLTQRATLWLAFLISICDKKCLIFACWQETCKKLHALIDQLDEERYDAEGKVQKADKEVKFCGDVITARFSWSSWLTRRLLRPKDWRPEHQSRGPEGCEETRSEEGPYVGRLHAEGSAGLQAHGQHGPEVQPEAGEEGDKRRGEFGDFVLLHPYSWSRSKIMWSL